ncbi:MAG: HNH endonuclease [Flavobacterium sp.]|nr:MAG: HNH endonuclease [Flavobacterium sp.]
MTDLTFNESDLEAIQLEKSDILNIWESTHIKALKRKIKKHYRSAQNENCCYCRKNTVGEFNMVLDIEHILPKSLFSGFMFEIKNLSISCKRCNMEIKKDDISFLIQSQSFLDDPFDAKHYKFIHPNSDTYYDHIDVEVSIKNENKMIKYTVLQGSPKGSFTYTYFKLHALEVDSFDRSQGSSGMPQISTSIDDDIANEIRKTLKVEIV